MASFFAGNPSNIDEEVLEAVQRLPQDFWVFAEFNVAGRQVDWFVARDASQRLEATQGSILIGTELKRSARTLRGSDNGPWQRLTDQGAWEQLPPQREINYFQQAVDTSNRLADWLWNNQPLYRQDDELADRDRFRVWPDLLLLSPPGVSHRLPQRPNSGYGQWFFDLDEWVAHLLNWRPKAGTVGLSGQDLQGIANVLGLTPLGADAPIVRAQAVPQTEGIAAELLWINPENLLSRLLARPFPRDAFDSVLVDAVVTHQPPWEEGAFAWVRIAIAILGNDSRARRTQDEPMTIDFTLFREEDFARSAYDLYLLEEDPTQEDGRVYGEVFADRDHWIRFVRSLPEPYIDSTLISSLNPEIVFSAPFGCKALLGKVLIETHSGFYSPDSLDSIGLVCASLYHLERSLAGT
jgi:hypothetical protein